MNEAILLSEAARTGNLEECKNILSVHPHLVNTQVAINELKDDSDLQNAKVNNSRTPLIWAVVGSNSAEVVELLLQNNADINITDKEGFTALHYMYETSSRFPKTAVAVYNVFIKKYPDLTFLTHSVKLPHKKLKLNSRSLPMAEASKGAFDHINFNKCMVAPERIISLQNGKGLEQEMPPNNWWNEVVNKSKKLHQDPANLCRLVGGCHVRVVEAISNELSLFFGDYLIIEQERKVYYVNYVKNDSEDKETALQAIPVLIDNFDQFMHQFDTLRVDKSINCLATTFLDLQHLFVGNKLHDRAMAIHANDELIRDLKILFLRMLSNKDEEVIYLRRIVEGGGSCASGFRTRVSDLVQEIYMPHNFKELIYRMRKQVIDKVINEYAREEVHAKNRISLIASIGFSVAAIEASNQWGGQIDDETIIKLILSEFKQTFRFYTICDLLLETVKSVFGNGLYYTGYKSSEPKPSKLVVLSAKNSQNPQNALKYQNCFLYNKILTELHYVVNEKTLDPIVKKSEHYKIFEYLNDRFNLTQDSDEDKVIDLSPEECFEIFYTMLDYTRPGEGYSKEIIRKFKSQIEALLFDSEKQEDQTELFIIKIFNKKLEYGYCIDFDWKKIANAIEKRVLEEKLFKSPLTEICKFEGISFKANDDDDAIDFFKRVKLTQQQFINFLNAYLPKIKMPKTKFLNRLLQNASLNSNHLHAEYLLSIGAELNQAISNFDLFTQTEFENYMKLWSLLELPKYPEYVRPQNEAKPIADEKKEEKVQPYEFPFVKPIYIHAKTPLMLAISNGNVDYIKWLLSTQKASVTASNDYNITPLHSLAFFSERLPVKIQQQILDLLLVHGAGVSNQAKEGKHTAAEFVTDNKGFYDHMACLELNYAIRTNNKELFNHIKFRGVNLSNIKITPQPRKQPTEHQLYIEAKRQHDKIQQALEKELKTITQHTKVLTSNQNIAVEIQLLVNDLALAAVNTPKEFTKAQNLVAILLQAVLKNYNIYSIANMNNVNLPNSWRAHINNILSKTSEQNLTTIVAAINQEFKHDGVDLSVSLQEDGKLIHAGLIDSGTHLKIFNYGNHYIAIVPSHIFYNQKEQTAELFKNLLSHSGLLKDLISARLKARCKIKSLQPGHTSEFGFATREELQSFLDEEPALINELTSFYQFLSFFGDNHNTMLCYQVIKKLYALNCDRLNELKIAYLNELRYIIQFEIIQRREDINRILLDDPVKKFEKQIHEKEDEIAQTLSILEQKQQSILTEEAKIENLQAKAIQLENSYLKQLSEIEAKIQALKAAHGKCTNEYKELKSNHIASEEKVTATAAEQQASQITLTELRAQQSACLAKYQSELAKQEVLKHNCEKLVAAREKLLIDQVNAKKSQDEITAKLKTYTVLYGFIEKLQKLLILNTEIFTQYRDEIKSKIKEFSEAGTNQFLNLYHFLTKFDPLKALISAEVEAEAGKAEKYFRECIAVIDEVLSDPTYSYDEENKRFIYKGYNVSWQKCFHDLTEFVLQQLESFRLGIENGCIVANDQVLIRDLPKDLLRLLKRSIRTNEMYEKVASIEAKRLWKSEIPTTAVKPLFNKYQFRLNDVIFCFIKNIDVISGNHLHIEQDIELPGIDIIFNAKSHIYLKPKCKITTSTPDAPSFDEKISVARSGSEYRKDSAHAEGRAGDNGLNGLSAYSAGHITISSLQSIENLNSLECEANGGNGANGQTGGNGDNGRQGLNSPPPIPDQCSSTRNGLFGHGSTQTILAEARDPGVGANGEIIPTEQSGPGGAGGARGLGGEGGKSGDIIIDDHHHNQLQLTSEQAEVLGPAFSNYKNQMHRKEGRLGFCAEKKGTGGKPGNPGSRAYPVANVIWHKGNIFTTKWIYKTFTGNFDIEDFKKLSSYGTYSITHFTERYSHQYITSQEFRHFKTHDNEANLVSTNPLSLGLDRSDEQNNDVNDQSERQKTNEHQNKALTSSYQNILQKEMQKLSTLSKAEASKIRTESNTSKLTAELSQINEKIKTINVGITLQEQNIAQSKAAIVQQDEQITASENNLNKANNAVTLAEEKNQSITENLLTSIIQAATAAETLQQANMKMKYAEIDMESAKSMLEQLSQARQRIAEAINSNQNITINEVQTLQVLIAELNKILYSQNQDLTQLKQAHQALLDRQTQLKNTINELNQIIDSAKEQTNTKVKLTAEHQVMFGVTKKQTQDKSSINFNKYNTEEIKLTINETIDSLINKATLSIQDVVKLWSELVLAYTPSDVYTAICLIAYNKSLDILFAKINLQEMTVDESLELKKTLNKIFNHDKTNQGNTLLDQVKFKHYFFKHFLNLDNLDFDIHDFPTSYYLPPSDKIILTNQLENINKKLQLPNEMKEANGYYFHICQYLLQKKSKRIAAIQKQQQPELDSYQHVSALQEIFVEIVSKFNAPYPTGHLMDQLLLLMKQEYLECAAYQVIPSIIEKKSSIKDFIEAFQSLTNVLKILISDQAIIDKQLRQWFNLCPMTSKDWCKLFLSLEATESLKNLAYVNIDILTLDESPEEINQALDFLNEASTANKSQINSILDMQIETFYLKSLKKTKHLPELNEVCQQFISFHRESIAGLSIENSLKRFKLGAVKLIEGIKAFDIEALKINMQSLQHSFLIESKILLQTSINFECKEEQFYTDIFNHFETTSVAFLQQYLFCLYNDKAGQIDLCQLESAMISISNNLLKDKDYTHASECLKYINQIDQYLNDKLISKVTDNLNHWQKEFDTLEKIKSDNEKFLNRYEYFYREDPSNNRKQFVKLLIKKSYKQGIKANGADNIKDLIALYNVSSLNKLPNEVLEYKAENYEPIDKINILNNQIRAANDIDMIFDAWKDLLQICVENFEAADIWDWHDWFVNQSIILLKYLFFDAIPQQKFMYDMSRRIFSAMPMIYQNNQSNNKEYHELFVKFEDFAHCLQCNAYKVDLYQHVDILCRFNQDKLNRSSQAELKNYFNTNSLPKLNKLLLALQLIGNPENSRYNAVQKVLNTLTSVALQQDPFECKNKIDDILQDLLKAVDEKDLQKELAFALQESNVSSLRLNLANILLTLTTTNLSYEELKIFVKQFINAESLYIKIPHLINAIYHGITYKCLSSVARDQAKFAALAKLSEQYPQEVCIAIVKLNEAINQTEYDKTICEIMMQCFGTKSPLAAMLHMGIRAGLDSQIFTSANTQQMAYFSALLSFSSFKVEWLQESIKRLLEENKLPQALCSLINNTLIDLNHELIDQKIKTPLITEQLKTIIANLTEENESEQYAVLQLLQFKLEEYTSSASTDKDFITALLNDNEILIKYILSKDQQLYANCLQSNDGLKQFIINNAGGDYTISLRKHYWRDKLMPALFGNIIKKYQPLDSQIASFIGTESLRESEVLFEELSKTGNQICSEDLSQIHRCKKYLATSHAIAISNGSESNWVDFMGNMISHIGRELDIVTVNRVLHVAQYLPDTDRIRNIMNISSRNNMLHALFYDYLQAGMDRLSQLDVEQPLVYQALQDPAFSSDTGLHFLEVLGSAIHSHQDRHSTILTTQTLNHIINLSLSARVYQNIDLVNKLEQQPMQYWIITLKRHYLAQQLKLDSNKNQQLLEDLVYLQNKHPDHIFQKWLQFFIDQSQLDLTVLAYLCNQFASHKWKFDLASLELIRNQPQTRWQEILNNANRTLQAEAKPRTMQELISNMQKSELNTTLKNLFDPENNNHLLARLIQDIKNKAVTIKNEWNSKDKAGIKAAIIEKAKTQFTNKNNQDTFLKNGNHEHLIDFLATMMIAVQACEGKMIRDTQLIALIGFITGFDQPRGKLANIATGEGKSLITRILAIACALRGEIVDVITSSKALAEPNAKEAKPLFEYFGLSVNNNCDTACESNEKERAKRYQENQVIYGEVSGFQRDYLLTNFYGKDIRPYPSQRLLVDEVDSMFIDNVDRVLYISHSIPDLHYLHSAHSFIWQCVNAPDTQQFSNKNMESIVKLFYKEHTAGTFDIPLQLKEFVDTRLRLWIKNAYLAKTMPNMKNYSILQKGEHADKVIITDLPTGVEQFNSQWSNGLHQFLQFKNQKAYTDESLRAIFISNISYFNQYRQSGRINGMSGTLGENPEKNIYSQIYGVDLFSVPRFQKGRYTQLSAIVVGTEKEWKDEIRDQVKLKTHEIVKPIDSEQQSESRKNIIDLEAAEEKLHKEIKTMQDQLRQLDQNIESGKLQLNMLEHNITSLSSKTSMQMRQADITQRNSLFIQQDKLKDERMVLIHNLNEINNELRQTKIDKENHISIRDGLNTNAVLVICDNKDSVNKLYDALKADNPDRRVYRYDSYLDELKLETVELQPGDIIVATNISSRGTDIEISKHLANTAELIVFLCYMPSNKRTELQAFRRTARKGQKGSGKFIVCDSRAVNQPVSIEQLRQERDELYQMELNQTLKIQKPRNDAEQNILKLFCNLQQEIRKLLEEKGYDNHFIELQIKSLGDKWAFWLVEHDDLFANVHSDGEESLRQNFDEKLKSYAYAALNDDQEMLVKSSGELIKLGKYYMDCKQHHDAIRCYEKAIERNPTFSGFGLYYLAKAIISSGSAGENKKKARRALRKATVQFEKQIARLEGANQVNAMLSENALKAGKSLATNVYAKTNDEEAGIYNIHIQAAHEALGPEITPATFETGEAIGEEAKIIFDNVRKHLPEQVKNYRLRKNIKIENDEFYSGDKLIPFPAYFNYCKAEVMALLKPKVGIINHVERAIQPEQFEPFILTQGRLLEILKEHLTECQIISPHPNSAVKMLGETVWQTDEFKGAGQAIKSRIPTGTVRLDKFITQVKSEIQTEIKWELACQKLVEHEIFELKTAYEFKSDTLFKVNAYAKEFVLRQSGPDLATAIKNIPLEKIAQLKPIANAVRQVLNTSLTDSNKLYTKSDFTNFTDETFSLLFNVLHAFGLMENRLVTLLNVNAKPNQHRLIEEMILMHYDKAFFSQSDLLLEEKSDKAAKMLWTLLNRIGVVRNPKANFTLFSDNKNHIKTEIGKISENVNKKFAEVLAVGIERIRIPQLQTVPVPGSPVYYTAEQLEAIDNCNRLREAIIAALENAVGTLRSIPVIKFEDYTLASFFENRKIPPIVVEYMNTVYCDVLKLVLKDKKGMSWDAFLCVMIGVAQIVIGAMIVAYFPPAAMLGEALISEGIGDITFAITSSMNGSFSWEAYGEHKVKSLAISLATAGVGAALSGATTESLDISQTIIKKLSAAAIQVASDIAISTAMSNFSEEIMNLLFDKFRKTFKGNVIKSTVSQQATILDHIKALYNKLTIEHAEVSIQSIIHKLNIPKILDGDVTVKVKQLLQMISSKLSGFKNVKSNNETFVQLATLGKTVATIMQVEGYASAINDIQQTPIHLISEFRDELAKRINRFAKEDNVEEIKPEELQNIAKQKLDEVIDLIINQIQNQVQQLFTGVGTFLAHLALDDYVESIKKKADNAIDKFYETPEVKAGLDAILEQKHAAQPQHEEKPVMPEAGELITANDISTSEDILINTPEGPKELTQLVSEAGDKSLYFTQNDGEIYLVSEAFSDTSLPLIQPLYNSEIHGWTIEDSYEYLKDFNIFEKGKELLCGKDSNDGLKTLYKHACEVVLEKIIDESFKKAVPYIEDKIKTGDQAVLEKAIANKVKQYKSISRRIGARPSKARIAQIKGRLTKAMEFKTGVKVSTIGKLASKAASALKFALDPEMVAAETAVKAVQNMRYFPKFLKTGPTPVTLFFEAIRANDIGPEERTWTDFVNQKARQDMLESQYRQALVTGIKPQISPMPNYLEDITRQIKEFNPQPVIRQKR